MTMPSSRKLPTMPCPGCPRGVWTARFPRPGVYAEIQAVTSRGVRIGEFYPSNEDQIATFGALLVQALDAADPLPVERRLALLADD